MADSINIEMVGRLVPLLLRISREEGRAPDKVLEEAFLLYLRARGVELDSDIGRPLREIYVEPPEERDDFLTLLDRMSSRFDLDPDEAMQIAVEEQKAFRKERVERERERERQ
jgi:hypothetical protein